MLNDIHPSQVLQIQAALIAGIALLGHIAFDRDRLVPIGRLHYFVHRLYGKYEPAILVLVDWLLRRKAVTGTRAGRKFMTLIAALSHYLPHGIIVPTESAENLVRHIEGLKSDEEGPRFAVGPCVCQMSLNRWQEPSCKDIVVLYGADIYLHLRRGYRVISADEAAAILRECGDAGLVHSLDFCMHSGRWHFVICNCDREICVLTRTFFVTGKMLFAGPMIAKQLPDRCRGAGDCGTCVDICMFGANSAEGGKTAYNAKKCYGCGQCARVCPGGAREMIRRGNYRHERIIPSGLLVPRGTSSRDS